VRGDIFVIKTIVLVAATISEHWVCGIPQATAVEIFSFKIAGNEVTTLEQPPTTFQILRNDASGLIAVWLPDTSAVTGSLILLDKRSGHFERDIPFAGGDSSFTASFSGTCRREDDRSN
jgi:hypothetical protein